MGRYKDLEGLLWEEMKLSKQIQKPKILPRNTQIKLQFDANRFRWFFRDKDGKSLQEWRDIIDREILLENAKYSETGQTDNESP